MKNALISPNEKVYFDNIQIGERVAQVETETFEVAFPLYWMSCEDNVIADRYYLANNGTIQPNPNYIEAPIDVTP